MTEWEETAAEIQIPASRPLIIAVPAIEKPAQPSRLVPLSFVFADQPSRQVFIQLPVVINNQITCQVIAEQVKLCTPIRAPTAIS